MPTYEYVCEKCGREFEVFQSMKDAPITSCTCGKKGGVRRKIGGGAGLIFKGTGFYITDYKNKPAGGAGEGKSGDAKPAAAPATPAAAPAAASSSKD